ncbi:pimeloyl-ACP methyl ester carboxylesterase [Kibdelosporangium banguiense]|uniref:Pimeloyl-ACP methyl ester carboxylesterase n=1 Tax=Kibdelosporangium banguiense TaxID=1365924 RepID=A0ABS4TGC1_9PSEU|nr:alpha/beta hydrolase [Kibdelosporangium banguiense]MBP2323419.1 pimeloyl-ACP methyl ester carboxylesterase [Kibdelosporangium banguiense]
MSGTQFLERPGGTLAYSVAGEGPLVVCSPGIGDLRSTFTDLTRLLLAGGLRVAAVELRGHGQSSTNWPSYTANDVADDLLAVCRALDDQPAVLLGSDYSGAAAVIAAAKAPDAVAGIVLSRSFVKAPSYDPLERTMTSLAMLPGLGRTLWMSYWPTLFATKPANFEQRRRELAVSLAEPGRFDPVREMIKSDHTAAERALPDAGCPALVVIGDRDPDCPDPAAEACLTADRLGGPATVLVVPDAGHYPHAEDPERVALEVVAFVRDSCRLSGSGD